MQKEKKKKGKQNDRCGTRTHSLSLTPTVGGLRATIAPTGHLSRILIFETLCKLYGWTRRLFKLYPAQREQRLYL